MRKKKTSNIGILLCIPFEKYRRILKIAQNIDIKVQYSLNRLQNIKYNRYIILLRMK